MSHLSDLSRFAGHSGGTQRRIIAATANPAKIAELQRLAGTAATVVPVPSNLCPQSLSEEQGVSVGAIAANKAVGWSRMLAQRGDDSLIIASDGGLLIPALGELWDPRRTRRFAGETADDRERSQRLLELTRNLTGDDREIAWREAVAIADQGELVGVWSASGEPGRLATTLRADFLTLTPGFWIPALWEAPAFGHRRLAELTPGERERIDDHWRRLREPVRTGLERYFQAGDLTEPANQPSNH